MTIALLALKWRANDDVSVRRSAISWTVGILETGDRAAIGRCDVG